MKEVQDLMVATSPPLPSVGDRVHYYCRTWQPHAGPWAATVSQVTVVSELGQLPIRAKVDLTVLTSSDSKPVRVLKDVPVVPMEAVQNLLAWKEGNGLPHFAHWWVWP
jgi:hypothetical protein